MTQKLIVKTDSGEYVFDNPPEEALEDIKENGEIVVSPSVKLSKFTNRPKYIY